MYFDEKTPFNRMRTHLIHRLEKPQDYSGLKIKDNPFTFGAGLHNGGMKEGTLKLLRPLFSFDYMGAAEFEFGAVPEAFTEIAKNAASDNMMTYSLQCKGRPQDRYGKPLDIKKYVNVPVYVLCPKKVKTQWPEVEYDGREYSKEVIRLSLNPTTEKWQEPTYLRDTLFCTPPSEFRAFIGWLELDNGFAWFRDKETRDKLAELFGVKVEQTV